MIRPTLAADNDTLVALARETGVFKPLEIDALGEVLRDYFAHNQALGHRSVTFERDGQILGFAYYAPAAMTDRTWYLYWIAVTRHTQARGIGSQLLKHAEREIHDRHGRLLLIETSSLPHYEPTRRFYLKHGYELAATLADFYADGDHLTVFRKRFTGPRGV
ncbi:MAG TPA: GNAT family N-acetyltransferase [Pirellulales bacterium]|jgi:GNAT superfamily N-acetyltransferase|nr:GNAT family N-acetyltransferase [Pirellulales bacterium]